MKPGSAMDQWIAFNIMGWSLLNYETDTAADTPADFLAASLNDGWYWSGRDGEAHEFKPSTDIAIAFEVVSKVLLRSERHFLIEKSGAWLVRFNQGEFTPGETLPMAICLAALKAHT